MEPSIKSISITTYNIQKLTNISKIATFLTHINNKQHHIIILTEFDIAKNSTFEAEFLSFIHTQNYELATSIKKRVVILVKTTFNIQLLNTDKYSQSSILSTPSQQHTTDITFKINHLQITIFGIYVPVYTSAASNTITSISQKTFFDEFKQLIPLISSHHLILAGDWNTAPSNIPTNQQDIQFHTLLHTYSINDIFHLASPKKNKKTFTNIATYPLSTTSNRRLDRFYSSLSLQQKININYTTYEKLCFSTHLPINIVCYFKIPNPNQTHCIPNLSSPNYHHRQPLIDSTLLSIPSVLNYIFEPTTIWKNLPLASYNNYIDAIQRRTRQLNKIIYNKTDDLQIFAPGKLA